MRFWTYRFLAVAAVLTLAPWSTVQSSTGPNDEPEEDGFTEGDLAFESRDLSDYGAMGVPSGVIQLNPSSSYYPPYVFVVDKEERVLTLWKSSPQGLKRVAAYPADIGKNQGNKRVLGDKATPEGIYFMLERYNRNVLDYSQYGSRAFTLDYPNFFDRKEKKTGSGIWLHAVPDTVPLTRGSRGCVVIRDDIIQTLDPYFKPGLTPVIIQDDVTFRTPRDLARLQEEINTTLSQWEDAWTGKDIDAYINFYHPKFRAQGMNKEAWKAHKTRLNELYEVISVNLSLPVTFEHKDQFVVRLFQHYRSDQHEDFGEKTLYLLRTDDGLKIVGEEWAAKPRMLAMEEIQRHSITAMNCAEGTPIEMCMNMDPAL